MKLYIRNIPEGALPVLDVFGYDKDGKPCTNDTTGATLYDDNYEGTTDEFYVTGNGKLKYKEYVGGQLVEKTAKELRTNDDIKAERKQRYISETDDMLGDALEHAFEAEPEKFVYLTAWYNKKKAIKEELPLNEET